MDDRIVVYEANIEDMLHVIMERLQELNQATMLTDFEKGRQLAYTEMWEIIRTRHSIIMDILNDND